MRPRDPKMDSIPASVKLLLILALCYNGVFASTHRPQSNNLLPSDITSDTRFFFKDDDSHTLRLSTPFKFLNRTYSTIEIGGDGYIAFKRYAEEIISTSNMSHCTPGDVPRILVYWADSDNFVDRENAQLLFRETTDSNLIRIVTDDITAAFPKHAGINIRSLLIISWKEMPFFGSPQCNGTSKRNTFQLVLAQSDTKKSFSLMNYEKLEWTSGAASGGNCDGLGGIGAKVGFDFGDGKNWYILPGTCTDSVINVAHRSNMGQPGKYVFQVDTVLKTGDCKDFEHFKDTKLKLSPNKVHYMGGVPLKIEGPCILGNYTRISCVFHDLVNVTTEGSVVKVDETYSRAAICAVPYLHRLGRMRVGLSIEYGMSELNESYHGYLHVMGEEFPRKNELNITYDKGIDKGRVYVNLTWNPDAFQKELEFERRLVSVERMRQHTANPNTGIPISTKLKDIKLELVLESFDGAAWSEVGVVKTNIPNTGFMIGSRNYLTNVINKSLLQIPGLYLRKSRAHTEENVGSWTKVGVHTMAMIIDVFETLAPHILSEAGVPKMAGKICDAFEQFSSFDIENAPSQDIEPCPPTKALAEIDSKFEQVHSNWISRTNPEFNVSVFRQSIPARSGAGAQCVYDWWGNIIVRQQAGITYTRFSPKFSTLNHFLYDVLPFMACVRFAGPSNLYWNTRKFYDQRPYDDGTRYSYPRVMRAVGDPHFTTYDGFRYTFNGIGEFLLVGMWDEKKNISFKTQVRMEEYFTWNPILHKKIADASGFTAIVMEQIIGGDKMKIQVEVVKGKFLIKLDGELLDDFGSYIEENKVTMNYKNSSVTLFKNQLTLVFSSGFSFKLISVKNENFMSIIGTAEKKVAWPLEGLMGNWDGIVENDLVTSEGFLLSENASPLDIHQFGLSWMVHESESIFTYPEGKSYGDYSKPDFKPSLISYRNEISEKELQNYPLFVDVCDDDLECMFDYFCTESKEFASATREVTAEFVEQVILFQEEIKMCSLSSLPSVPENGQVFVSNFVSGMGYAEYRCIEGFEFADRRSVLLGCSCKEDGEEGTPRWDCNGEHDKLKSMNCTKIAAPARVSNVG